jgi:hypothetical protein
MLDVVSMHSMGGRATQAATYLDGISGTCSHSTGKSHKEHTCYEKYLSSEIPTDDTELLSKAIDCTIICTAQNLRQDSALPRLFLIVKP